MAFEGVYVTELPTAVAGPTLVGQQLHHACVKEHGMSCV